MMPESTVSISEARMRELDEAYDLIDALKAKLARVEADRKKDCVEFFYWWWNQNGTNTEQGYDAWLKAKVLEKDDAALVDDKRR